MVEFCFFFFLSPSLNKIAFICLQLETRLEESKSELGKEQRMRERIEENVRQLKSEIESLKRRQVGRAFSPEQAESTQEVGR